MVAGTVRRSLLMFLMFGDEADAEQGRERFFVYGAIFVEVDAAKNMHTAIGDLRDKNGFAATESLKFADGTRPRQMTRAEFRNVKKETIRIAKAHDVRFCAYVTSHAVRLMWKRRLNGRNIVRDYGLVIRPLNVRHEPHKTEYQALINRLQGYLDDE
jgi:hypothetical protein